MNTGAIREYPGYEAVMEGGQVFNAGPGLPLVTYGADKVLSRSDCRHIFRDLTGEVLDWNLWCLHENYLIIRGTAPHRITVIFPRGRRIL
ncbi:MAG: hypothetical protein RDV48_14810 [Candidatus Eremiobacteraeota bacterium]|nr:hypothetical protein [Candidatus Eremiobacteraeota bacterium]